MGVIQGFDIMQDVSEPAYIRLPQLLLKELKVFWSHILIIYLLKK